MAAVTICSDFGVPKNKSITVSIVSPIYLPGFPGVSDSKTPACNLGDPGLIPGLRGSPGEGNDNPL